jgi:hypothetical protein
VHIVGAGLGHNIDRSAGGGTQIRSVIAAIDLEFLHIVLAYRQAHAAAIARGLAAIDGYAVSPAIAAVKRQPALRSLLDSEILVPSQAASNRTRRAPAE